MKKPEVTVIKWTLDELLNGREFSFIDRENDGFGAKVWVENDSMYASFTNPLGTGYTGMTRTVKKCANIPIPPVEPPIPIPVVPISKVRVDGLVLRNEDNSIFSWRGASSFLLFRRLLEGDTTGVISYVREWSKLGYNVLRVFSQVDWAQTEFYPSDYPNYDAKLSELLIICAAEGMYVEIVALTFEYDLDDMAAHVNRLHNVIKNHKNVFLELGNEINLIGIDAEALLDKLNTSQFTYPWAVGIYTPTILPKGTYVTAHTPRDDEWPRKAKHLFEYRQGGGPVEDSDPAGLCPCIGDEPIGGADYNENGRRSNVPLDFKAYGALAQLIGAGSTYHHESGLQAIFPDGVELDCAKKFIEGCRLVSPNAQLGAYTRIDLDGCPLDSDNTLRSYGMILGNLAIMVRVRPTGAYVVNPGWKVTSEDVDQMVITLARV